MQEEEKGLHTYLVPSEKESLLNKMPIEAKSHFARGEKRALHLPGSQQEGGKTNGWESWELDSLLYSSLIAAGPDAPLI